MHYILVISLLMSLVSRKGKIPTIDIEFNRRLLKLNLVGGVEITTDQLDHYKFPKFFNITQGFYVYC